MLAVAPDALGGIWLRARAGPAREAMRAALTAALPGAVRLHPAMDAQTLTGGTDLTATLAAGRLVTAPGLLAGPAFVLVMAERCPPALAALLAQRMDRGGAALIALDESAEPDEGVPPALAERLGLFVDLDGLGAPDGLPDAPDPARIARARARYAAQGPDADHCRALTAAAAALGIGSARAVLMALACARAAAALRDAPVSAQDLDLAAALVLAPRATRLPDMDDSPAPPSPDTAPDRPDAPDDATDTNAPADALADRLVDAARTALPADLMERLAAGRASRAPASGSGARRKGSGRGRPLPPRPGRPGGAARVDVVATLAAAAPWQALRRRQMARPRPVVVLPGDIRVKRFQDRSERLLVMVVDASGSQAMTRLAESKGAVELLLARAYVRRDQVALIAFRGTGADLLLPPTRALVAAKRRLAGLPGGGGTPLAAGLQAALDLAVQARGRGLSPALALLTDGRANIGLDGQPGRVQAAADARRMAQALAAQGLPVAVIDTALRPGPALADLAALLGTVPVALPRLDAGALTAVLGATLDAAAPPARTRG